MRLLIDDPGMDRRHRETLRACVLALICVDRTAYRLSLKTGLNRGVISKILKCRKDYSVGKALNKLAAILVANGIWYNSEINRELVNIQKLYANRTRAFVRDVRETDIRPRDIKLQENLVMWIKPWLFNKRTIIALRILYKSNRIKGLSFHNYLAKADRITTDPDCYKSGEIEGWLDRRCRVIIPKGTLIAHYIHPKQLWHQVRIKRAVPWRMPWQGQIFRGKVQNPQALGLPASFESEYGYV